MKRLVVYCILFVLCLGCKKPPIDLPVSTNFSNGFFALNEGLFQQNNASLSFYSHQDQTMSNQVFSHINGRGLGDTANDMISFGFEGKWYYAIAINVSSQIEILDGLTLESIAQIGLFDNGIARQPRTLKFFNGYLYSINFDGTISLINMESLSETSTIVIGDNPESSLIYQNKLYAINTGGLNFPNYDSTVSVIDLNTHQVLSTFTVGINGSQLIADAEGDGYLISRGNYGTIEPTLVRVDLDNYAVKDRHDIYPVIMTYANNVLYYYNDLEDAIFEFDTKTETTKVEPLIDCSDFENVYKIIVNETEQLIYVIDANGYVNSSIIRIYNLEGDYQRELISGLNTNTLIFVP